MRAKNLAGALALMVFGVVYGYLTSELPERTLPNTPGPSFFPWLLTICLLLLACLWLAQIFQMTPGGVFAPQTKARKSFLRAGSGLAIILGYLVVLPHLGFLWATPLVFGLLMWLFGERRPIPLCFYSVVFPLVMYGLFKLLFQIPLPASPFLG